MNKAVKYSLIGVLGIVGVAHIGLLGYVFRKPVEKVVPVPTINIPKGPYSSYKIKADQGGYEIEYRSDDPKVLSSSRSLDLEKEKRGIFGGGSEVRSEYRTDQYTREGTRNIGGVALDNEGKLSAKDAECLVADAGARSQGAMAGTSLAAGLAVPAVASIPYVGWLAGGWALLLGQNIGEAAGSTVNSMISDC